MEQVQSRENQLGASSRILARKIIVGIQVVEIRKVD